MHGNRFTSLRQISEGLSPPCCNASNRGKPALVYNKSKLQKFKMTMNSVPPKGKASLARKIRFFIEKNIDVSLFHKLVTYLKLNLTDTITLYW